MQIPPSLLYIKNNISIITVENTQFISKWEHRELFELGDRILFPFPKRQISTYLFSATQQSIVL